jgi:hypothetical protein
MSWIAYINGNQLELSESKPIAQTKQVNDLAKLDNRQTNFTNRFIAPLTANNVKAMDKVYLVGNQSNLPYEKNLFDLFDSESGECLIYKGWANVSKTTDKGYEIYIYDGYIDFYRSIENKSLTDIGIAGLNHAKSLTNITTSWNNTLPYMYAISDYNGKNKYTTTGGTIVEVNTDYQIPSARVSYIWDQIFAYAGFTYSGSFFATEAFKNMFMTFPKPIPKLVPHRVLIHTGTCYPKHSTYWYFTEGGAYFNAESYLLTLPRENFTSPYAYVNDVFNSTAITAGGSVYNHNRIHISIAGTYSIDAPANINFNFYRRNAANAFVEGGVVTLDPTGMFKTYLFNCNVGDQIAFLINGPESVLATLTFDWSLNRIDGYEANFEDALVDFKAITFVNEIMQHAGLTAFKDKYTNHIDFKSIDELLRTTYILDWSKKYQGEASESYRVGKYAKKNNFKYRYNGENETYNDGAILVNDENLADEDTVIQSKIYSPERDSVIMAGKSVKVYKIWDKNLKEDATIEYKDLSGRFYFLRFEIVPVSVMIGSESLSDQQAVTQMAMASYTGLTYRELILANYGEISRILDKAKMLEVPFYLTPKDVADFDFKSLIYIEQLSSYYMINKIINFVKNKATKCEIIEVDYIKVPTIIIPPGDTASFITVNSINVVGCVVTLTFSTDANIGATVNLVCGLNTFGLPVFTPPDPIYGFSGSYIVTGPVMTVSFTLQAGAYYDLYLQVQNVMPQVNSLHQYFENNAGCVISSPSTLTITNVTLLSQDALNKNFKIDFTSDAVLPRNVYVQNYKMPVPIDPGNPYAGSFGGWSGYTDNGTATIFSINHSVSRIFGDPLKLQIRIGTKESNIYNI